MLTTTTVFGLAPITASTTAPTIPTTRMPSSVFVRSLEPTTPPPPPQLPLCPTFTIPTSSGCLYPPNTITAFFPKYGKWRVALTLEALKALPRPPIMTAPPVPLAYARWGFGAAATHQTVVEYDRAPPGVQQVDQMTYATATGEMTAEPSQPLPPEAPPPLPPMPPPTTPMPSPTIPPGSEPPVRVDVGPTVVEPPMGPRPDATRPRYAGCIARFNKSRRVFSIYCPINSPTATPGLGIIDEQFRCLYGNCGLGADPVSPPIPEGFTKVAETTSLPGAGETVAGEEKDKFFRAKNPMMWLLFIGTAAAAGGGGYWYLRRRRSA